MYFKNKINTNIDNEFGKKKKFSIRNMRIRDYLILGVFLTFILGVILLIAFKGKDIVISKEYYFIYLEGDDLVVVYKDSEYIDPGYSARNDKGVDFTDKVVVSDDVNTSVVGDYKVIYTLGDTRVVRYVSVIEKPIGATSIYLSGEVTMYLRVGDEYKEPGYTVIDSIDSNLTDKVIVKNDVDTNKEGIYRITYMVTNSTGVSTQVSRTVIVMGSNISISLDNEKITNGSVGINVYVVDNYFDYMVAPNGEKVSEKKYTYQVNENGEYKFSIYDKLGKSQEKSILVSNIDKEAPNGSCTGLYGNGKTSINIKAVDNTGISKYVVNGRDYSSNNITLDKDYSSVSVVIYDKAGNSKNINCSMKEDIVKLTPKFELYSISPSGGVKMEYWLNVPEGSHSNGRLVMFLHGDSEVGSSSKVKGLPQVQFPEKYQGDKYILVAPITTASDWNSSSRVVTLKAILDKVADEYKVNKDEIYITGFSRGAIGTWNLVNTYPGYFKGAMPVSCCGNINANNFKSTRVLAISGSTGQDAGYINCMQKNVDKILAAGGVARKITYNRYGHGETQMKMDYQEAFDWLFSKE